MIRPRDPKRVREDAISAAIQKGMDGCEPCAQSYFAIARQHGATERDIEEAIAHVPVDQARGISRRDLLKIAAASVVGLAVGAISRTPELALARSFWWGTDGNTSVNSSAPPVQFYVGKLGDGVANNANAFLPAAANKAGCTATYMYWDLEGPASPHKPGGDTPYQWGYAQANAAANAWYNAPYSSYVCGNTIFADVEVGNYGWGGTQQSDNQKVLEGWLDGIYVGNGFSNGVYVPMNEWVSLFGSGYRANHNFAFWVTRCQTCATGDPCGQSAGTTESQVQSLVNSYVAQETVGGSWLVMQQYWISSCSSCGDYDVCITDPTGGTIASYNNATTYQCVHCRSNSPCP